jgi:trehalose 6-phosphate phosphatase
LRLLADLTRTRALLAFDYDGTLAPIVADRELAVMRDRTQTLFSEICELYPCAVISGRSKADVAFRLGGAQVKHIVGNHGLEPGNNLGEFEREVAIVRPLLALALAPFRGVDIEDKGYSIAIHYRRSRQKRIARSAIHAAVEALPLPMRVVGGKLVVNVVPVRAANKGDALVAIKATEAAESALYVGDDVTDEDVFEVGQSTGLFTVRVGRSKRSAAQYFLRDQREIDVFLAMLVELRCSS